MHPKHFSDDQICFVGTGKWFYPSFSSAISEKNNLLNKASIMSTPNLEIDQYKFLVIFILFVI